MIRNINTPVNDPLLQEIIDKTGLNTYWDFNIRSDYVKSDPITGKSTYIYFYGSGADKKLTWITLSLDIKPDELQRRADDETTELKEANEFYEAHQDEKLA